MIKIMQALQQKNHTDRLMRKLFTNETIHPGTGNGTQQGSRYHPKACTDLCKQWPGACARHRPAQTEHQSSNNISFIKFLWMKFDRLSVNGLDFKPLDQCYTGGTYGNGRTNHTIHVKRLKPEHLLYPEPGYDLSLHEDDTEKYSGYQVFTVIPPRMGES